MRELVIEGGEFVQHQRPLPHHTQRTEEISFIPASDDQGGDREGDVGYDNGDGVAVGCVVDRGSGSDGVAEEAEDAGRVV